MAQKRDKYIEELIENGISSSFWKEYFVPMLNGEIERYKDALADCSLDNVRAYQERIGSYRELLKKPFVDLNKSKGG